MSRLRLNIAAVSSVVALSLAAAIPAQAQTQTSSAPAVFDVPEPASTTPLAQPSSLSDCPPNRLCLFKDIGFTGTVWHFGHDPRDDTWVALSNAANDQATGIFNNRGLAVWIAKDDPHKNDNNNKICFGPGFFRDFGTQGGKWPDGTLLQDSISAYNLSTATNACISLDGL